MLKDYYIRCLVKRDQSTVVVTPNYSFIFCILIRFTKYDLYREQTQFEHGISQKLSLVYQQ